MDDVESGRDKIIQEQHQKEEPVKSAVDDNGLLANPSPTKLPPKMNPNRRKSWFSTNMQDESSENSATTLKESARSPLNKSKASGNKKVVKASIPKYTEKHQKLKLITSQALKEKMILNKQKTALNDPQQNQDFQPNEEQFKAVTQPQKVE